MIIWTHALQTTNPLIARPFYGSPKCTWYLVAPVLDLGIPSTQTFLCRTPDIESGGNCVNVFGYDAVFGRDSSLLSRQ